MTPITFNYPSAQGDLDVEAYLSRDDGEWVVEHVIVRSKGGRPVEVDEGDLMAIRKMAREVADE